MLRLKIYMPIVNKGVDTLSGNRVSEIFSKNSNLKYFFWVGCGEWGGCVRAWGLVGVCVWGGGGGGLE